jgi:D-arginine utilization repressor
MKHPLDTYIPICDAIAALMAPKAEVVLHDLKLDRIHYIANCFSKRQIGDGSLNDLKGLSMAALVIGPYGKQNWNGRQLKSISAVLKDKKDNPIGLFCVNYDIEGYAEMLEQITSLVAFPTLLNESAAIFSSDWRERINQLLAKFTKERNITLAGLTNKSMGELIAFLDEDGAFEIRNATKYLAEVLNVSRATIYNRLKKVRDHAQGPTQ